MASPDISLLSIRVFIRFHKLLLWSLRNWLSWIKPCNFPAGRHHSFYIRHAGVTDSNGKCCHFIARNSLRRYWSRCPPRCWLGAPHLCASVGKMLELCVEIWVAWRNPHTPQPRRKDHWTWWGEWDGYGWPGNQFVTCVLSWVHVNEACGVVTVNGGTFYTMERLTSFYGLHHSLPGHAEEPAGWASG